MAKLFEPTKLNNIELKNRFVRSAAWLGLADRDGYPTEGLTRALVEAACGGVGLIVSGHVYVSPEGRAGRRQLGICSDDHIGPLREVAKAVRDAGGKIVAQISHAGCEAVAQPAGSTRLGPSAVERNGRPRCVEMMRDDLVRLTQDFAGAAFRAKEAGFDGVQLHAAHGYLLSQFLSPYRNKRQDGYGGSIENRARMLLETFEAVRAAVGAGFGIMVKINSEDFREDGLTVGEMLAVSAMLEERGVDAIEMSGGRVFSRGFSPHTTGKTDDEAYYLEAARAYKEKVRTPLMLVGGIRSYEVADRIVSEGTADYIALCRPLIAEPDLINRWESGDRRPSVCESDNLCFKGGIEGTGVRCALRGKQGGA